MTMVMRALQQGEPETPQPQGHRAPRVQNNTSADDPSGYLFHSGKSRQIWQVLGIRSFCFVGGD